MSADLSVLMATRNRADLLKPTLEAMCRVRRGSLSVEFVIVPNACTDQTHAVLAQFQSRLPLKVLNEPVAGKCRALNRALRDPELGRIVVFTDDDVTPEEDWLLEIVASCDRLPNYSVFGGRIDCEWPNGLDVPKWAGPDRIRQMAFSQHIMGDRECEYAEGFSPYGPNYWVRREALRGVTFLESIGPRPGNSTLGDETLFLEQLRSNGHALLYCPSVRVRHRIEADRVTWLALCNRALQYGRGWRYVSGVPAQGLLERSRTAWQMRVAAGVVKHALGLPFAALILREDIRAMHLVDCLANMARNWEALRSLPSVE